MKSLIFFFPWRQGLRSSGWHPVYGTLPASAPQVWSPAWASTPNWGLILNLLMGVSTVSLDFELPLQLGLAKNFWAPPVVEAKFRVYHPNEALWNDSEVHNFSCLDFPWAACEHFDPKLFALAGQRRRDELPCAPDTKVSSNNLYCASWEMNSLAGLPQC